MNKTYQTRPQPSCDSSYYPRTDIDYAKLSLDLNRTAQQVDRQIRAYSFRDFQMPEFNNVPIFYVEITNNKSTEKAGTVLFESDEYFKVSTIDYDIFLYKDRFAELMKYVAEGELDKIKKIKDVKRYIREQEKKHGWTLLMIAAYHCQYDVVDYLITLGSDVNAINYKGTTVIMFAKDGFVIHQNEAVLKRLLIEGANPYQRDFSGQNLYDYTNKQNIILTEKIKQLI